MNKKLLYAFVVAAASAITAFSQKSAAPEICGTMPHLEEMKAKDPKFAIGRAQYEAMSEQWIAAHASDRDANAVITIPVVVHVLYNQTSQNITDNQVKSQIQVLNEDFGRTNTDASQTPAAWTSIAANTDRKSVV